jgi:hypothetical protein
MAGRRGNFVGDAKYPGRDGGAPLERPGTLPDGKKDVLQDLLRQLDVKVHCQWRHSSGGTPVAVHAGAELRPVGWSTGGKLEDLQEPGGGDDDPKRRAEGHAIQQAEERQEGTEQGASPATHA